MAYNKSPYKKPRTAANDRHIETYVGYICEVIVDKMVSAICTIINKLSVIKLSRIFTRWTVPQK